MKFFMNTRLFQKHRLCNGPLLNVDFIRRLDYIQTTNQRSKKVEKNLQFNSYALKSQN